MTDKINGLLITLDKSYRDDDVQTIINAIQMIKGVINVEMNVESTDDYFAKQQFNYEVRKKLYEFIDKELK